MKKPVPKFIVIFSIIVVVSGFIFFNIDKSRIENNNKPIFALPLVSFKDGGSILHYGIGYQIMFWHKLDQREEDEKIINGYSIGYEIWSIFNSKFTLFNKNLQSPENLEFIAD